jgi:hypothetical protein
VEALVTRGVHATWYNEAQARISLLRDLLPWVKVELAAGRHVVISIKCETRSQLQNSMLHAMLAWCSKFIEWAGRLRRTETWKRLMVASWGRARNEHIEFLPALDGQGVDIVYRPSSTLTTDECSELIEFVFAWCAMNGYQIPDKAAIEAARKRLSPPATKEHTYEREAA